MQNKDDAIITIAAIILAIAVPEGAKDEYVKSRLASVLSHLRFNSKKPKLEDEEKLVLNRLTEKKFDSSDITTPILLSLAEKNAIILSKKDKIYLRIVDKESSNLESSKVFPGFISFFLTKNKISYDRKNISHLIKRFDNIVSKADNNDDGNRRNTIYALRKNKETLFAIIDLFNSINNSSINNSMNKDDIWQNFASSYYYNNLSLEVDSGLRNYLSISEHDDSAEDAKAMLNFKLKPRDLNTYIDSISAREILVRGIKNSDKISAILKKNNISSNKFLLFLEKVSYLHDSMTGKTRFNQDLFERDFLDLYKE